MRWILASVGCLALASVVASPSAWADNPDEEKVVASEHYVAVVDGLDEGLIQRALAELKEHHPAVKAKADVERLQGKTAEAAESDKQAWAASARNPE